MICTILLLFWDLRLEVDISRAKQTMANSKVSSKGLFRRDDPLLHPLPILTLQLGAVIITSSIFQILLKPFKQPRFVSHMLAGIILGPSIFQYLNNGIFYSKLFNGKQSIIADVLELVSFSYFGFLIGVRTDISLITSTGKLSWIVGIATSILPVALAVPTAHGLSKSYPSIGPSLNTISVLGGTTSFHVTSILLEDLHLLNSEIGRLALSCSLISNLCGMLIKSLSSLASQAQFMHTGALSLFQVEIGRFLVILIIIFILRPVMFYMMKKIPEGSTIKESHLAVITIMLFGTMLTSETLGLQAYFGGMVLGFAVPSGPPLGSGLAKKLNLIMFALMLPAYIIDTGRHVNVMLVHKMNYGPVELVVHLGYMGKFIAAVVPARHFGMPFADAFSLGFILTSQGFFDIMLFKRALRFSLLDEGLYSILTITAVFYAAVITPIISILYNPSKRYANYRRRTIQHSRGDTEVRILVSIHEEETIFSLMNLLKASHSTRARPLGVYILDLMELAGREHPLLINHQFHKRNRSSNATRTDRIINAFRHHEHLRQGLVKFQFFTAITPYDTMHDDICVMALERSTSLLVITFQNSDSSKVRSVKKNVLDKAPCSVGILVNKKIFTYFVNESLQEDTFLVCVIFTGGPDSREALAYGMRMAENPRTKVNVIQFVGEDEFIADLMDAKLDLKMMNEFRSVYKDSRRVEFRNVTVQDGAETSRVLLSLDDKYNFILVGRRVNKESSVVSGLTEWNNYIEELGIIGDILASSDMKSNASVLVLQQQSTVEDMMKKFG
ncbi:unnamed protein product [Camellia sinensis]